MIPQKFNNRLKNFFFAIAYNDSELDLACRIERVKRLLSEMRLWSNLILIEFKKLEFCDLSA